MRLRRVPFTLDDQGRLVRGGFTFDFTPPNPDNLVDVLEHVDLARRRVDQLRREVLDDHPVVVEFAGAVRVLQILTAHARRQAPQLTAEIGRLAAPRFDRTGR